MLKNIKTGLCYIFRDLLGFNKSFFIRKSIQVKFPHAYIAKTSIFLKGKGTSFHIGKNSSIGHYSILAIENDKFGSYQHPSALIIGSNTYIGEHNNIRAGGGIIKIGDNCLISQGVSLIASNHSIEGNTPVNLQPWDSEKVGITIGNDVWIGCNSVILPGVTINSGAIIGAGSIVTTDVPTNAVFVGNPAKFLKNR